MTTLPDIAAMTAREHGMFAPGSPIVAMVSGGADSMALLHLLTEGHLGSDLRISVLHVNHLLRDTASDEDAEFVAKECDLLGVDCRIVRFDVAGYATSAGLNLEDAGRTVRYRFAAEEADARARGEGAATASARIAVAHTLDDRIETFLMRLLSGAGAGGLASIRHVRDRVVRPLLDLPRDEVRTWLAACGRSWREDATNLDTSRLRSRIRYDLLPALLEVNPAARTTLARTMRILAEEDALLAEMAEAYAQECTTPAVREGEISLDRAMLLSLPVPMRRRTVLAALRDTSPEVSRLDSSHVDAVVEGLSHDRFARDLPAGLRARSEYGRMVISRGGEEWQAVAPSLLPVPGSVDLGPSGMLIAEVVPPVIAACDDSSIIVDAGDATCFVVGPLAEGDRMKPLGMQGTKKLSDLLVDAKVPRSARRTVPVVRDGERVVWLAGVRQSEEYKVRPQTTRAVRLRWNARTLAAEDKPREQES